MNALHNRRSVLPVEWNSLNVFYGAENIGKGLLLLPDDKCYSANKVTSIELRNIDYLISISFKLLHSEYLCSISWVNPLSVLSHMNLHSNELKSSISPGKTRRAFCFVLTTWIRRRFLIKHFYCGMSFDFTAVIRQRVMIPSTALILEEVLLSPFPYSSP